MGETQQELYHALAEADHARQGVPLALAAASAYERALERGLASSDVSAVMEAVREHRPAAGGFFERGELRLPLPGVRGDAAAGCEERDASAHRRLRAKQHREPASTADGSSARRAAAAGSVGGAEERTAEMAAWHEEWLRRFKCWYLALSLPMRVSRPLPHCAPKNSPSLCLKKLTEGLAWSPNVPANLS